MTLFVPRGAREVVLIALTNEAVKKSGISIFNVESKVISGLRFWLGSSMGRSMQASQNHCGQPRHYEGMLANSACRRVGARLSELSSPLTITTTADQAVCLYIAALGVNARFCRNDGACGLLCLALGGGHEALHDRGTAAGGVASAGDRGT
jgi:hypothetical protein